MKSEYIELSSGVRLHCYIFGNFSESVLLFVHGWAGSSRIWFRYMKTLGKRTRAIALDLKGFGDSSKPKSGYSLARLADEAYEATKLLGAKNAIVIAHSMGGQVGMYMAIRHPDFVKKLVIVDSAEKPSKLVSEWLNEAMNDYKSLLNMVVPSLFDNITKKDLDIFTKEALKMTKDSVIGTLSKSLRSLKPSLMDQSLL